MAKDQTRRLSPATIVEDKDSLAAIEGMAGYVPADPQYTVAAGQALRTAMNNSQNAEAVKEGEAAAARDAANAAEWAYHNWTLGAKKQVIAKFGEDSDQVQALGLKKKSERKKPSKKKSGPPPNP